ncbi:tyrosine recombinase [Candidatus Babeliales bacterium]|nr:tyrosine recombinase [Candidatus Babeliales bacterium]
MHDIDKFNDNKILTLFQTYLLTEKRVSMNTFFAYKKDIDQLFNFLKENKICLKKCNKNHLKRFLRILKRKGLSAKTLSRKISSLKTLFNYLNERFKLSNRASSLVFPKLEKKLPIYLTETEVQQLLMAANEDTTDKGIRNRVMLYLLYASGMRVSELVSLTIDQIHFDTGFVSLVGKGNKERLIPLPKNVMGLLKYYIDEIHVSLLSKKANLQEQSKNNYLFFSYYKGECKSISRQSFWIILKKILSRADIVKNVSPHTLRHSLATHLLKSGANIRSLQLLLGHEQLSTVQIYTHLQTSHIRKVYDKKHPRA